MLQQLLYCKVIRANTSHPGLVSHPEFMGLRMPDPGSHEIEDHGSRLVLKQQVQHDAACGKAALYKTICFP